MNICFLMLIAYSQKPTLFIIVSRILAPEYTVLATVLFKVGKKKFLFFQFFFNHINADIINTSTIINRACSTSVVLREKVTQSLIKSFQFPDMGLFTRKESKIAIPIMAVEYWNSLFKWHFSPKEIVRSVLRCQAGHFHTQAILNGRFFVSSQ